ncbi:MAG TPA: cupredoxin domain-containing protein [Polyangia bacterium]
MALLALSLAACKSKEAPPPPPPAPPAAAPAPAATGTPGRVEVAVTEEGFVPSKIPAKAGEKLTLAITRKTEKTCATNIMFAGQEGKTDLPLNETVEVAYVPNKSGEVKFGCSMGMMIGGVLDVVP